MANETTPQPTGLNSFMATVTAWLTGKDARLTELETKLAALATVEAQLAQVKNDLATARQTISTLEGQVQTLTEENTKLKADIEKAKEVSTVELTEAANVLAGQRLATIGVQPVKEEIASDPNRTGGLIDQFNSEPDSDKRAKLFQDIKKKLWKLN